MEGSAAFQDGDVLADLPVAGVNPLDVAEPKHEREAVLLGQPGEGRCRSRVRVERSLKVLGNLIVTLPIGTVPPAVSLGTIDFGLTAWSHAPFVGESSDVFTIHLRPRASGSARRERLQKVVLAVRLLLSIDPAMTERYIERLGVGDARQFRRLLSEPQSQARVVTLILDPSRPLRGTRKQHDRLFLMGNHHLENSQPTERSLWAQASLTQVAWCISSACMYYACMPNVQVRDVPNEVHEALVRRAEQAGQSLQQFLASQLAEIAATPTVKEILDRIERRPKGALSAGAAIEALDEERARR